MSFTILREFTGMVRNHTRVFFIRGTWGSLKDLLVFTSFYPPYLGRYILLLASLLVLLPAYYVFVGE